MSLQLLKRVLSSTTFFLLLIGTTSLFALGFAVYLQFTFNMDPCPKCIVQRYLLVLVAIASFGYFLLNRYRMWALITALMLCLTGVGLSLSHIYRLAYPSVMCGKDALEAFLNSLWPARWMPSLFQAKGFCSDDNNLLFSVPLPFWTLLLFTGFAYGLLYASKEKRPS